MSAVTLRRLRRSPGYGVTMILTLALAIGVNGVIFSAVQALLVRPLPFPAGEQLVWAFGRSAATPDALSSLTDQEANALAARADIFTGVAVIGDRNFVRQAGERRDRWRGIWVTPSLAPVLGIRPAVGRAISIDDAQARGRVMMISHERWLRDFGGDSSIVGRRIEFSDNRAFTVVGVLPPALEFPLGKAPSSGNGSGYAAGVQDFWIGGQEGDRLPGGTAVARMRSSVDASVAQREAAAVIRAVSSAESPSDRRDVRVVSIRDHAMGLAGPALRLAQAFAVLMLVLACVNLTNLTLIRLRARDQELGVLAALGAPSVAFARAIGAEVAVLAAAGAALGLALAAFGRVVIRALTAGSVPLLDTIAVDWTLALFTAAIAVAATLCIAVLPARIAMRSSNRGTLSPSTREITVDRRGTRLRAALVVSQVSLALTLSVGAALIAHSFIKLMSVDAGYDPRGVISAEIEIMDHPNVVQYYRDLMRRLESTPGIEAAGLVQSTPLTGKWTFTDAFTVVGRKYPASGAPQVAGGFVAFDYFGAMHLPLVAGRDFTDAELTHGDAPVLIINQSAARRFFAGENPLDHAIVIGDKARRIVGVVADERDMRLDAPGEPKWYQPLFGSGNELIVRTSGASAKSFIPTLRRVLTESDNRLVVERVDAFEDMIASTLSERRMATRMVLVLAAFALGMAALGLYGVLSFGVQQRRRELGVRAALGASPSVLLTMVLRGGVALAMVVIAIGFVLAIVLTGALRTLLFEVSPTEPLTFAVVAGVAMIVAIVASVVPAWSASKANAMDAIRLG